MCCHPTNDGMVTMRQVRPSRGTSSAVWQRAYSGAMWELNRLRLSAVRRDGLNASTTAVMHMQAGREVMQSHEMDTVRHSRYNSTPPNEPFRWIPQHVPGIAGFGVPPHATATVALELLCDACKFKVISLIAC